MADKNLIQVDGGQATDPTGGRIYIILPAATPSSWQDYYIDVDDLQSDLTDAIAILDGRVDINEIDISELQDLVGRKIKTSTSGSSTFSIDAESFIGNAVVYWISNTPTVKLGTTPGGNDLIYDVSLSSVTKERAVTFAYASPLAGASTLYLTVTGGVVSIVLFESKNIVTI